MLGPLQGGGDPAVTSLFQLLEVLSNPDRAKAVLDEIATKTAKAEADQLAAKQSVDEANRLLAEAQRVMARSDEYAQKTKDQRDDANLTIRLFNEDKAKFEAWVKGSEEAAAAQLIEVSKRESAVSVREQQADEKQRRADELMAAREREVIAREKAAVRLQEDAAKVKDEYEKKLRAMKQLVSGA